MLSASSSLLSEGTHYEVATPENNTVCVHVCVGMEGGGATGMGGGGWSHTQSFFLMLLLFIYFEILRCIPNQSCA